MYKEYGFIRVGSIVPKLKVADINYNVEEIIAMLKQAASQDISIVTTPELSLTGYTCADLFHQDILLEEAKLGLKKILKATQSLDLISIIGMPLKQENKLYNTAVVIKKGKILGIIPKTYLPNYSEFYEKRWFESGTSLSRHAISLFGEEIPMDTNLLFQDIINPNICFGIEICEDLWTTNSPSTTHALNGATMIFNLSASNELIGKQNYRRQLVKMQSAQTISGYIYASSGIYESSTDLVFSGHAMIAENGSILAENKRFSLENNFIYTEIDVNKLTNLRIRNTSYSNTSSDSYSIIPIEISDPLKYLKRTYPEYPFVPNKIEDRKERCQEILEIQACGLAKRLLHTGISKTVIGISGGLDSTLAFFVILATYQKLNIDPKNIIAVTMPGFGTTTHTYQNACDLVKSVGATLKEIPIQAACLQHFKDIGLDLTDRSVTYENAQARERTQILMDIANLEGALVIGTGDLSELALGWCTYNGDHMSMYAVNTSIPKTLVRHLVTFIAEQTKTPTKEILQSILDTPISPELLPPNEYNQITQITENHIGPYVLHDFFLYHFLKYGASPDKIYLLAKNTFQDTFTSEELQKWLIVFFQRFFQQQFKRSCLPDGPKVGTISLSPRGDFRMPSDASANLWLKRIKKINEETKKN